MTTSDTLTQLQQTRKWLWPFTVVLLVIGIFYPVALVVGIIALVLAIWTEIVIYRGRRPQRIR